MIKKIVGILLIALSVLVLQSCLATKKYTKPNVETENVYKTKTVDTASISSLPLRKLFTDSLLQGYIKQGLDYNYDLRIALVNLLSYQSQFLKSRAEFLPSVSGNLRWTHQDYSKSTPFARLATSIDQFELSTTISWEADIWGKIRSAKRAAFARYLQSKAGTLAIKTKLIADIASGYFQLMATDAKIEVTREALKTRRKSLEVIRRLKKVGSQNEVAVKQIEAQCYATEVSLQDLEYTAIIQENALNLLLGSPMGNTIKRNTFKDQKINVEVKSGLPALLLSRRPDVIQAEAGFMNAFELTNVARASLYPSFTIAPNLGLQAVGAANLFSPSAFFSQIVTGLVSPLFNKRLYRTNLEVARNDQKAALYKFQQTLITAGKEVSDAIASYNNESKKLDINAKQLESLVLAVQYTLELLDYGSVDYLSVLTATNDQLTTEIKFLDNKLGQMKAVVDLYRALGGGV